MDRREEILFVLWGGISGAVGRGEEGSLELGGINQWVFIQTQHLQSAEQEDGVSAAQCTMGSMDCIMRGMHSTLSIKTGEPSFCSSCDGSGRYLR